MTLRLHFSVVVAKFGVFKRADGSGVVLVGPRGAERWWSPPDSMVRSGIFVEYQLNTTHV